MRGKKTAMFLLTDNELQHLRKSSQYTARNKKEAMNACCGRCYDTELFVTFDLFMDKKKNNQFRRSFDLVGEDRDFDFEWRIDN